LPLIDKKLSGQELRKAFNAHRWIFSTILWMDIRMSVELNQIKEEECGAGKNDGETVIAYIY
jgi:hypothetical protein